MVLKTECELGSCRIEGADGLWNVVESAIDHNQELVDTALLELVHELKGCDLELFGKLFLRDGSALILFAVEHIVNEQVSGSSRCVAVRICVVGVRLQRLRSTYVQLLKILGVS